MHYRFNSMLGRLARTTQFAAYNPAGLKAVKPQPAIPAAAEHIRFSTQPEAAKASTVKQWTDPKNPDAVPHHLPLEGLDYVPNSRRYQNLMKSQTYFHKVYYNEENPVHLAKPRDRYIMIALYAFWIYVVGKCMLLLFQKSTRRSG